MPPRITRNSYRPRASDRTMVDLESPFASGSRKIRRRRSLTRGDGSEWAPGKLLQGSLMIVGWISRKHFDSGRGRSFFLTSLLIELIDRMETLFDNLFVQEETPKCLLPGSVELCSHF